MLKNYFIVAWRDLFRNKIFSLGKLPGLTISITCSIPIFLWVQEELNYKKPQPIIEHLPGDGKQKF